EVMVGREGGHLQVDLVRRSQSFEWLALEAFEEFSGCLFDVLSEFLHPSRVVVFGLDVALDDLEDGLGPFEAGGEDELVAPDRMPAELTLIGAEPLVDEAAT